MASNYPFDDPALLFHQRCLTANRPWRSLAERAAALVRGRRCEGLPVKMSLFWPLLAALLGCSACRGCGHGANPSAATAASNSFRSPDRPILLDAAVVSVVGEVDLATVLPGRTFEYWAVSRWGRGPIVFDPLDENFLPIEPVREFVFTVLADGASLRIAAPRPGGEVTVGKRIDASTTKWTYALDLWAGGEFVVWSGGGRLQAAFKKFGSGVPLVAASRGEWRAPQ
jgi:hypothetical protein